MRKLEGNCVHPFVKNSMNFMKVRAIPLQPLTFPQPPREAERERARGRERAEHLSKRVHYLHKTLRGKKTKKEKQHQVLSLQEPKQQLLRLIASRTHKSCTRACGMYVIYICDGSNGHCFMPLLDDLLRISQRAMVIFSFSIS